MISRELRALAAQARAMANRGAMGVLAEHVIARLDAIAEQADALEAHIVPPAARVTRHDADAVVVLFDEARRRRRRRP